MGHLGCGFREMGVVKPPSSDSWMVCEWLTSPVTKMFTLVYRQQFLKVGKLLVYKLVNKILETVVHTQE